jgi:hypothetical protein
MTRKILPDSVNVFPDGRIVEDLGLQLHFFRLFPAEYRFLLERLKINSSANIALADLLGIVFFVLGKTQVEGQERKKQNERHDTQPAPRNSPLNCVSGLQTYVEPPF